MQETMHSTTDQRMWSTAEMTAHVDVLRKMHVVDQKMTAHTH